MVKDGYKQTEIGLIPNDWEIKNYDEVFNFLTTATYSRANLTDEDTIQYLHYGDIHTKYHFKLNFDRALLPTIPDSLLKKYPLLKNGDIIMADASEDYEGICKSVEVENIKNKRVIAGLHTFLLRDKNDTFVNGFKAYLSSNSIVRKQFNSQATGMKVFGVSKGNLKNILIPIPPKEEQKAIAKALSDTDELITSLEKLISKKEAIKQGTMQQLLTAKKRLNGFNGKWEEKRLGDIGKTYGGLTGKKKNDFGNGNGKYITFLNVMNNIKININILEKVLIKNNEKQNVVIQGDLLFNTSSETPEEVGMCALLTHEIKDLYLNSFCFGYRIINKNIDGLFLSYYINSNYGRRIFNLLGQGATRYNLSKANFNNVLIRFPSISEQQAIAQILSDMDDEIEILKQKLSKTKAIKDGIISELLTGKTRLKVKDE